MKTYLLTLTADDRVAIDAVDGKYCTGDIYQVLVHGANVIKSAGDDSDWFSDCDLTFEIQSWAAFSIIGLCALENWLFPMWFRSTSYKFKALAQDVTGIQFGANNG